MRRLLLLLLLALLLPGLPAGAAAAPVWTPGPVLDQGGTAECVAYALAAFLAAGPAPVERAPSPDNIYAGAQARDGAPLPHIGTWVPAALAYLQAGGYIAGWHRAPSAAVAGAWLDTAGPILMSGPFQGAAQADGTLPLPLSGGINHAWFCYADLGEQWACQNSWGPNWNTEGGRFRLHSTAVDAWTRAGGEIELATKSAAYHQYWKGLPR